MTFRSGFLFFFNGCPIAPGLFVEKETLPPLNCFCIFVKNQLGWEFPGCPVVRIQHFHCCKLRLNPWLGKSPQAMQTHQKKKKRKTKENQLGIFVKVSFWVFYLVPLIYISFYVPGQYCFDDYNFSYSLKSGTLILPAPFSLPKIAFIICGLLCFHTN